MAEIKAIEATPEMRAAGAVVIEELYGVVDSAFLAARVYIAMARVSHQSIPLEGSPPPCLGK